MMDEIWKILKPPFNKYAVSNLGNVKNIETQYVFRKGSSTSSGYERVRIKSSDGKDRYTVTHRLVAEAFLKKPKGKEYVHHINGIRNDNRSSNLEWVTCKENQTHRKKVSNKSRPVIQYSMEGEFIKKWEKISDTPYENKSHIGAACSNPNRSAYGFKWKYFEEEIKGEIWKKIKINEEEIGVSNKGRVRLISGKVTFGWRDDNGYMNISVKGKIKRVHQLIAEAFLKKEKNRIVVDHIDRNKQNNNIENLRWASHSENRINSKATKREVRKEKVEQIIPNGDNIKYESIHEASRKTGISKGNICSACKGNRPKAGGYKWRYFK